MAGDPEAPFADELLADVTRKVVHLVTRDHPLTGNQLHELASQLQRLATHRIVEERLRSLTERSGGSAPPPGAIRTATK